MKHSIPTSGARPDRAESLSDRAESRSELMIVVARSRPQGTRGSE
jgi:hypothetical protein